MVLESRNGKTGEFMKASFQRTYEKALALISGKMEEFLKEILLVTNNTDLESTMCRKMMKVRSQHNLGFGKVENESSGLRQKRLKKSKMEILIGNNIS